MKGDEGDEFIPLGKPLTITFTCPLKPFSALTETVTGAVVPPTRVETEEVEMAMLKSGTGGGGEGEEPPHPMTRNKLEIEIRKIRDLFMLPSMP